MVDEQLAYECYCTEAEVKERNEQAMREGRPPGYDGRCRDLTADERAERREEGRPVSVRFRTPDEGRSSFTDIIRGEVSVEWSTISDFVIVRSNGTPVFFLANAVDDLEMNITHVLRGEDLIDSTHRVLALRRALGHDNQPLYAHMPLILGPGGGKLSKRHGAVSVEEYRDAGYLPAALINYLALLGWGPEDGREILTLDELVAEFDARTGEHVGRDVRSEEARVDERRAHPGSAAGPSWSPRSCRSPATGTATGSTSRGSRPRSRWPSNGPPRSCRSPTRWPSSSPPTTTSSSTRHRGRRREVSSARPRSSTPSSTYVENCEWSDADRPACCRSRRSA